MKISIRPYAETDLDVVAKLWLESWRSTGAAASATTQLQELRQRLPAEIAGGWDVYVATRGEDIVGFLALIGDQLHQLFISPAVQSQGIGAALLAYVRAKRPGGFWLTAFVENARACRFYEREGLIRGGVSKHPRFGTDIVRYDWRP